MTRGMNAFQMLFTFSNETGLRFWGIVELPTWLALKPSAISAISVRWRCRMSSARFAMTPSAVTQPCARSLQASGSTICVEWLAATSPSCAR